MQKKEIFLLFCLSFLFHWGYPSTIKNIQNPGDLLTSAKKSCNKFPDSSIILANRAYQMAKANNNRIIEIKSLDFLALRYWERRNYDNAKLYGKNSLRQAEIYHIDSLKGEPWMILGLVDHTLGDYRNAIDKYSKSVSYYKRDDKTLTLAKLYLDIGICQMQLSDHYGSIHNCLRADSLFENAGDYKDVANTDKTIASCFVSLSNYPKAIEYNKKALIIRQKQNDRSLIAQSYNNIGNVFNKSNQPDSAILYLSKSVALYHNEQDSSLLVLPLQNLGLSWKMKGNYNKAESYIKRSLNIAANYKMREEFGRGNLDLASLYLSAKRYDKALESMNIAEKTAKELNLPELLMSVYTVDFNMYKQRDDYKAAFLYLNKHDKIKDSLFTVAKNRTIDELEIHYQTSQKEKDIAALNTQNGLQGRVVSQQKLSITVLVIAAVLLLLLFIIAYRSFLQKKKSTQKIQLLNAELNHRVKNNLQILSGLIVMQLEELNDEGARNVLMDGEARLTAMNMIHDKLFLNHEDTKIWMDEYLTKLLNNIKISFGGDRGRAITLLVDVDNIKLEADKAVAIGLIINELATNSFKYAFDKKFGEIYMALKPEGKSKLLLTFRDNGRGLTEKDKDKSLSFGLKLVNLMSAQLGAKMSVQGNKGTLYQFEIGI